MESLSRYWYKHDAWRRYTVPSGGNKKRAQFSLLWRSVLWSKSIDHVFEMVLLYSSFSTSSHVMAFWVLDSAKQLIKLPCNSASLDSLNQCIKCPYSELFWSVFPLIRTEYGDIGNISLYSVQMQENAD